MGEEVRGHYSEDGVARKYQEYWSKLEFPESSLERARSTYRRFTSLLKPGGGILDAGCGTGLADRFFISGGFTLVGIDSSEEMLEIARSENPGVAYLEMDVTRLDFGREHFDGIWSAAVLLHLPPESLHKAMNEFHRVLKSGGVLYIATRTSESDHRVMETASEGGQIEVYYYSSQTLLSGLKETGFDIIWDSVNPDDSGRPFDYIHIICSKAQ